LDFLFQFVQKKMDSISSSMAFASRNNAKSAPKRSAGSLDASRGDDAFIQRSSQQVLNSETFLAYSVVKTVELFPMLLYDLNH
jgi:hypothetical protein